MYPMEFLRKCEPRRRERPRRSRGQTTLGYRDLQAVTNQQSRRTAQRCGGSSGFKLRGSALAYSVKECLGEDRVYELVRRAINSETEGICRRRLRSEDIMKDDQKGQTDAGQ